jgi:transmembrane sensor
MNATVRPAHEPSQAVLEAAAGWRMRMDEPGWTPADEAALDAWLAEDAAHEEAFARTGEVFGFFEEHAAAPEMMRARRDAIDRAQRQAGGRWTGPRAWLVRLPAPARIAAGIAAAAVLGMGIYPLVDGKDVYATGLGERRVVTLPDGSKLSLDGQTKIVVRYTKGARELKLVSGQARFDVTADPLRPFKVAAGEETVAANAGAFNIDASAPRLCVTLIQGQATVLGVDALHGRPVELRTGEQLVASTQPAVTKANLTQATAWQNGKIIFDDEPLAEAAARVNRYTEHKVVVEGAAKAERVSGVFDAGDVDAFVEAVTYYLPVKAARTGGQVVLQGAANG